MKIKHFFYSFLIVFCFNFSFADQLKESTPNQAFSFSFLEIEMGRFFPIGYYKNIMNPGYSLFLKTEINPYFYTNFYLGLEAGALFSDFKKDESQKYSILPIGLLADYQIPFSDSFSAGIHAGLGYYFLKGPDAVWYTNLYAKPGLSFSYTISSYLKASIIADFVYFNDAVQGISGYNTALKLSYVFDSVVSEKEIALAFYPALKLFSARGASNLKKPIGEIKLKNISQTKINDLKISFFIKDFMSTPFISKQEYQIEPGKSITIPLYALLSSPLNDFSSDKFSTGKLEIEFVNHKKEKRKKIETLKVQIFNKNSLTWENLNHFGSFITFQDKTVSGFARSASQIQIQKTTLPDNFILSLKIISALKNLNIQYLQAPKGSYKSFTTDDSQIDSVRYPVETLKTKTANCADSTALLASLLESIGIPTAFVVTPDHIYLLIESIGLKSSYLVDFQGKSWIPIETTLIHSGFKTAWENGFLAFNKDTDKKIKTSFEAYSEFIPNSLDLSDSMMFNLNQNEIEKEVQEELKKLTDLLK